MRDPGNEVAGEPCVSGPPREQPRGSNAPITAVENLSITAEHRALKLSHNQPTSSSDED